MLFHRKHNNKYLLEILSAHKVNNILLHDLLHTQESIIIKTLNYLVKEYNK